MTRSKRNVAVDDTDLVKSLSSILLLAAELRVLFLLLADWARMLFLAISGAAGERMQTLDEFEGSIGN